MANPTLIGTQTRMTGTNVTSDSVTLTAGAAVGDGVQVSALINTTNVANTWTFSDTQGNPWVTTVTKLFDTSMVLVSGTTIVGVGKALVAGNTITITASNATTITDDLIAAYDLPGQQVNTVDQSATATAGAGIGSLAVGPTGATTQALSIALAIFGTDDSAANRTTTLGGGYTTLTNLSGNRAGLFLTLCFGYLQLTVTGTQSVTGTFSAAPSAASGGILVTFHMAAAPAAGGGRVPVIPTIATVPTI